MTHKAATEIINKYDKLIDMLNLKHTNSYSNLNFYIRKILVDFMHSHKRVGLYCYGEHTKMLMADYVAEIRELVCIIDNGNVSDDSTFTIIRDEDIEVYELDGIIVSSYKLMDEIKSKLHCNHPSVDVLDMYEALEDYDIFLEKEFYNAGPYQIYTRINSLQLQIRQAGKANDISDKVECLKKLLEEYIHIKEFRLAENTAQLIYEFTQDDIYKKAREIIADIYDGEIKLLANSSENNTLLLCLDGMRREDFLNRRMPKVYEELEKTSYIYTNAYSYSTMTFESLVPAFSENTDQHTGYYLSEEVSSNQCRFIKKALDEKRFIAVYGDGNHYVYDEVINYTGNSQTVTEKLWDFVIDVSEVDNGVFYLHELYESHYSFANPYTEDKLISNGSAMLFDYLPQNRGQLRTDYRKQHDDALNYLDDTLAPFVKVIPCKLVMFADHGNLIVDYDTTIDDITKQQLVAAEEWIRIPLLIRSNAQGGGECNELMSLMDINDIMIAVMSGEKYTSKERDYIKIGRSAIYNQQFKELYRLMDCGYNGEAFEGFIFEDGHKLIVYSNGNKELYKDFSDILVDDEDMVNVYYNKVVDDITIM